MVTWREGVEARGLDLGGLVRWEPAVRETPRSYRERRFMEAKAVTSGMTAMSRRSREHRTSKNIAGTIQESQLDMTSTSKNPKVGILSSLEHHHRKDSSDLRRSSRVTRFSPNPPGAVFLSKGLEARVAAAKEPVKAISNAPTPIKSSVIVGGASEALKHEAASQGVCGSVQEPHAMDSNHMSAVSGVGGSPDAAGQPKGRLLRGRPRGKHVAPIKKISKRAKRLQEVPLTESDGIRILGRRIKVFWRDENKWFYGIVKAYNRGRNSHKIVYDDKEEEWLKLHEEKFKLQVLAGEVFGSKDQAVSRQSTEGTDNGSSMSSFLGKSARVSESEQLNGDTGASSANGDVQTHMLTSFQLSSVRQNEKSLEYPGFCSDGGCREQGSSLRKAGFDARATEELEGATPVVIESVDIEDPYAIDHISISDSLVKFMRSKQSLLESRKVPTSSVAGPPVLPAAVAANTIEVSPSLEPSLCIEAKDKLELSDIARSSSDARDVFCDHASSEGYTLEERRAPEGILSEDGKGSVESESLESAKVVDVDSITESLDIEDPYAMDHTSMSDSLVMFMKSKQSLVQSTKFSEAIPSVQPTALVANPVEVFPSLEPFLCNETKDKLVSSGAALVSTEARDAFCDPESSEGCAFEERGASEGIPCVDGKGSVDSESLGIAKGVDVDLTPESLDVEDPYAIDHTSMSDSVVMFLRSKLTLTDSRNFSETIEAIPSVQHAAVTANPIEIDISDVALSSSDACDAFCDLASSEGCIIETRASGRVLCEDGMGFVETELRECSKVGGLDSATDSAKPTASDLLGSSEVDGLQWNGQRNVEGGVVENVDVREGDMRPLGVILFARVEEDDVRLEAKYDQAHSSSDDVEELRSRAVKCSVLREVGSYFGEKHWARSDIMKGLALKRRAVSTSSLGGSIRPPLLSWVVRTERYISQYVATNLVKLDCTVPGHYLSSWISDIDGVWRNFPYLTLCVDVVLESSTSQGNSSLTSRIRCCGEHIAKGMALRRNPLSSLGCKTCGTLACFFFRLGTARLVLQGTGMSLDDSDSQLITRQGNIPEVVVGFVEENPPFSELPCSTSEDMAVTQPCEPATTERPHESMLVGQSGGAVALPVLEVLDNGVKVIHVEGDIDIDDASLTRNGDDGASEPYPAAPRVNCTEDDVIRDTNVPVGAGSAGGLTEVQIGSAVEGEDEGGLACYRSWKSVKRGFSQVTPEDLGNDGLGPGGRLQGLLDSELGCMALTKRQKVHAENLRIKNFEYGNDNGEKDLSPQEGEVHGDMNTRSADTGECDSGLPRVNVLKLRKCSTGKGGWRVAGNSCMTGRTVMQPGDGDEPSTPSSTADRKRSFSECFNQPESPEENGHPVSFIEDPRADGHEPVCNADGIEKAKGKGLWSNCEVASINDVTFNPRKRFKNGSTSSGSSDDSYATHFRAEETYPSSNLADHTYQDSVCQGCMANVLVVQHDRGWREFGATIELQFCHGQGWMLIVSVRGENMYAIKAEHAIVAGTTNRHSHAIVWKGGKGWSLEFEDKKQWQVFKELHEECYRRNAKTSSVRQIPIPGVRHIDDIAPRSPGFHFVRPYSRYITTMEDEVEMALGNSRVVYDMDSEDEQWLAQINTERASARGTRTRPLIAEETLERLMDKLEKDAYLYQQQHTAPELDPIDVTSESCTGLATQEVIKVIYNYWSEKRRRKGMPLVRHFQPPAWEQYQKQVKLWEQEIARLQLEQPSANMQQLAEVVRKPPYFAFCLRPRGLEAKHKLSKQKSHRKQSWSGSAPRPWVGLGGLDGLGRRQYYTEPGNGLPPGPRRPGRPRLTGVVGADLTGSFNAIMREHSVPGGASKEFRNSSLNEYAQRRAGKKKKVGRKAHRQRLLAAAQESRRKRLLMRNIGSLGLQQPPTDLALAAARARSTAEAARARAQALYAVADAAMHKAVAAVIAADSQHAVEHLQNSKETEYLGVDADTAVTPMFGSWRRGVPGGVLGAAGTKGSASRQGLESYGEDALLPVASWSQELGAGLGTRLLNKDAEVEGMISTRTVHVENPPINGAMGRMRGEGMVAMPTR